MAGGNQSVRMLAQPLRSLAFGSISGTYAAIGAPFIGMVRILHISNLTNADMTFSFTGNTDHIVLPTGGFLLLDLCSNQLPNGGFYVSENTQMFVKQTSGAASSGSVYISAFYAAVSPRD